MKKFLALTALCLLVISCKKEKTVESDSIESSTYSYVTNPGSYWIYNWYQREPDGSEDFLSRDTVWLVGDTLLDGNVFQKFLRKYSGGISIHYERDSSGYIINTVGDILYSYNNVSTVLNTYFGSTFSHTFGLSQDETISTNFGQKTASVAYQQISRTNGDPINECGDTTQRFYNYYVSGIGKVQGYELDLNMINWCTWRVSRLSEYYIAP